MDAVQECVTSGINEARFIQHIRELFTTSTVALAELAQNARRANASEVRFDLCDDGRTLVVSDNGGGIDDFAKLIRIAESGWAQEVVDDEQPFGIGFMSVSFTADEVLVESKGKSIRFTPEDLVSKRPIRVMGADFIGGTRITLGGFKLGAKEAAQALRKYAAGFPIPVVLNGERLPRPYAQAMLPGEHTEIGFLYVPGVHLGDAALTWRGRCFCQGLPVNVGDFSDANRWVEEDSPVAHIDHHKFRPRVPDRDVLIDQDAAARCIDGEIRRLWIAHLDRQKRVMDAAAFAERYWQTAAWLGCLALMNDVPVLPKCALTRVEHYPRTGEASDEFLAPSEHAIGRDALACGAIGLCAPVMTNLEGDSFARMMFAREKGWLFVDALPADHWAARYVVELDNAPLAFVGLKTVATGEFSGRFVSGTVKIVDELKLMLNGETAKLSDPVALGNGDSHAATMLVPRSSRCPAAVLTQVSDYRDENESYRETDHALDEMDFENLVDILCGEPAARTLEKVLVQANVARKHNLLGARFTLAIDEAGNVSVEAAA